jgi:chromosome segregation and condensation protein ScpB
MPVEERRRVALRRLVSEAFGEEAADTLFELVTPPGESPATERSIDELRTSTERNIDELRTSTRRGFDELRTSMEAGDARLEHQLEGVEHRLTAAFERRLSETFTAQTRVLVFSQLGTLVAIAALAFGLR